MKTKTFKLNPLAAAVMMATASSVSFSPAYANGGGIGLAADGSQVQTYYANTYVKNDGADGTGNAVRGLRKFIDTLPGVTQPGGTTGVLGTANNLGQYIPLAVADTTSYFNSDYYEIAVVEYSEKMHTDLAKATTLRGYVQIDRAMTNTAGAATNTALANYATALATYNAALSAYNTQLAGYQAYQNSLNANTAANSALSGGAVQAAFTTQYNTALAAAQTAAQTTLTAQWSTYDQWASNCTLITPILSAWGPGATCASVLGAQPPQPTAPAGWLVNGRTITGPANPPPVLTLTVPTFTYSDYNGTARTGTFVNTAGTLSAPGVLTTVTNPGTFTQTAPVAPTGSGTPSANSKGIALTYLDGSPVMVFKENADHSLVQPLTKVQAYAYDKPHYLGPVIMATKGRAVRTKFVNALPAGRAVTNVNGSVSRNGDQFLPVDETLTGAGYGPDGATKYTQNRTALHWHGGDTPWISDGTPHQWIIPADDESSLPADYKRGASQANVPDMPDPGPGAETLYYPNNMSARLMWTHDHALAITRINVYSGMAAGYLLTDKVEVALTQPPATSTALSGVDTIDGATHSVLGAGLPALADEIPLVIQDKTFVANDIAAQDVLWDTQHWGAEGDLWFPHVYEINQNPAMNGNGTNPVGRWDYGPWFWPVFPAPLALPTGAYGDVTTTPEAFMDTPMVNGTAYPTVTVAPKSYRLRILNASNDRFLNLSFFVADPTVTTADGRTGTEVKMVPFTSPNGVTQVTYACPDGITAGQTVGAKNASGTVLAPGWTEAGPNSAGVTLYPNSFPCAGGLDGTGWGQADNRPGGVPYPGVPNADGSFNTAFSGPHFVQIGTEGGLLPNVVDIPPSVVNYEYNKRSVTVLNVLERGLFLGAAERADVVVDFSAYAGKTLILYNDSPVPLPAGDPRIDYYTDDGDQTGAGGAPNTLPGFGPNTRTVMQFKVSSAAPAPAFNTAALATALPTAYAASQEKPFVTESAYNNAFGTSNGDSYGTIFAGSSIQPNFVFTPTTAATQTLQSISLVGQGVGYTVAPTVQLSGGGLAAGTVLTILPVAGTAGAQVSGGKVTSIILDAATINSTSGLLHSAPTVTLVSNKNAGGILVGQGASALAMTDQTTSAPAQMKAIQELFDPSYGRMNATLGVELPFTSPLNQTTIPLGYIDPTTEFVPENQIQIWKITHNGVDTHPVHFHLFNLQVINRVGWDGTIKPPYDNEQGWKETLKMNPLEDVYVAVRPRTPTIPFGVKDSVRLMDPSQPAGAITGFTQIDPMTGVAPIDPVTGLTTQITNASKSYGWEYVWHCHILGHEENDFMRPINFAYASVIPNAPTSFVAGTFTAGSPLTLTWVDPTPATASATPGNKQNEIGFIISRATATGTTYSEVGRTLANATSYTDTPPTLSGGNTGYKYQVVAYNQAGSSVPASITVGTTTAAATPLAPSALSATANSSIQVTLSWTDNSGSTSARATIQQKVAETGFVITRAVVTSGVVGAYSNIATAPAHTGTGTVTYVDTTAQPSTAYSYQVIATNAGSNSTAITATATTPAAPNLTPPSNVTVQMTSATAAVVNFTDLATGETMYVVQVSTDSGKSWGDGTNSTFTQTAPAFVATLAHSGGAGGAVSIPVNNANLVFATGKSPFLFRVAAATGTAAAPGIIGAWGNLDSIDLSGQTVIGAASGFTATQASTTSATLTWVDNANNNVSYALQYTTNGGTTWSNVGTGTTGVRTTAAALAGNSSSAAVSGLTAGQTVKFRLQAVGLGTNASAWVMSNGLTLAAPPTAPVAPTFGTGSVTATGLTLNWAAVSGATGYTVQQATVTAGTVGTFTTVATNVAATTLPVTGLTGNTQYVFHVLASNASGNSAYSANSATQLTLPGAPGTPATPTNVTATSLTLSWTAPTGGATTYTVQRATDSLFTANVATSTSATTSLAATGVTTGLTASTTYYFRVLATNATGNGAYSGSVSQATQAAPVLPAVPATPTTAAVTATSLTLNWAAVSGATSYTVQRATNAGFTAGPATSNSATNSLTTGVVAGLTANTTYYYRVLATNAAGSSAYSAGVSQLTAAPAVPTGVTAANGSVRGAVTGGLNWTAAPGAISYNVQYSTVVAMTSPTLVTGATSGVQITMPNGTAAGSVRYMQVQSVANGVTSAWSAATAVTVQ